MPFVAVQRPEGRSVCRFIRRSAVGRRFGTSDRNWRQRHKSVDAGAALRVDRNAAKREAGRFGYCRFRQVDRFRCCRSANQCHAHRKARHRNRQFSRFLVFRHPPKTDNPSSGVQRLADQPDRSLHSRGIGKAWAQASAPCRQACVASPRNVRSDGPSADA